MEKNECQQLCEMFDEIDFIERLEQFVKNANNGIRIMANPQCSNFKPIVFPDNVASFVLGSLTSYKDSLKDLLSNLKIVDKSVVPEEPEPIPEPTPEEPAE